ncbi:glycine--tRNA ligase subunit beta, partial [Flavihumibacter cheonanensis]|uniref:glycine--tRNA ligase subunit beta n=1 Tax=Flavihumibacter cheonanensis TaxID=1442385 RepID=UPI001EF80B7F
DRLDTIAGGFAIGQKPTGTRDPFGLRRAALGVLRILVEGRLPLNLRELIAAALAAVRADLGRIAGGAAPELPESLPEEIYDYMMERLRAWWLEGGR